MTDKRGNERDNGSWSNGKLPMQKSILRCIIGGLDVLYVFDSVDNGSGRANKEKFRGRVVK
jgi:hypothetical protein